MGETRWLDDREQAAWRRLAAVVLQLPAAMERQLQSDAGMSHFEYWVLAMLSEAPDRTLQLRDLAAQGNTSPSRLSHVVRRLEDRGWLRRVPCPGDARASNAVLTDEGWSVLVDAAPGHVECVRGVVFDRLDSDDVDDLARICDAILVGLDARPQG